MKYYQRQQPQYYDLLPVLNTRFYKLIHSQNITNQPKPVIESSFIENGYVFLKIIIIIDFA